MASDPTPTPLNGTKKPEHIFVFDNPRSRSHLFWRWMSTHPDIYSQYHPFWVGGYFSPEESIWVHTQQSEARRAETAVILKMGWRGGTYASDNHEVEKMMEDAEAQGKALFVNEHCTAIVAPYIQVDLCRRGDMAFPRFDLPFPNPTYVRTPLLEKFTHAVILIRHPILQVDSLHRGMVRGSSEIKPGREEHFDVMCCLHFSRVLFEYLRLARGGKIPIVVDGEDILWRTEELGTKFSNAIGVDPSGLKCEWEKMKGMFEEIPLIYSLTATIHESTGIERPAVKPELPNRDQALQNWTEKYGIEPAQAMIKIVDAAMPHYEYLIQYKL